MYKDIVSVTAQFIVEIEMDTFNAVPKEIVICIIVRKFQLVLDIDLLINTNISCGSSHSDIIRAEAHPIFFLT